MRRQYVVAVVLLASVYTTRAYGQSSIANHLVISEVQVGGAVAGDEFIELHNPTNSAISLNGWRLTRKTSTGTESILVADFGATAGIAAHGFFLVAPPADYDGPAADKTYTNTSNRLAASNTVLLYSDAQVTLVDKAAWGAALDAEGTATANPASNGSIERKASCSSTASSLGSTGAEEHAGNRQDADINSADFVQQVTSNPQNTSSASESDSPISEITADAGEDQEVCAGGSVQIGGAPTASGGAAPLIMSWSPSTGLDDASVANPTASPATTTIYTVEVTDPNGCKDTDEVTVAVTAASGVSFNPVGPFCENDSPVNLSNFVSPAGGTFSGAGISGNLFDPGAAGAGTHMITYVLSGTCGGSESRNIAVRPLPALTFTPVGPFLVSAAPVDLSSAVLPAGGRFSGSGISGSFFDPAAAGAGTHQVTYSFTDGNGCSNSVSRNVVVDGASSSSPDLVFIAGDLVTLDRHGASEGSIHSNKDIHVQKGRPSTLSGNLRAVDDIVVRKKNSINGDLTAGDEINVQHGATINGMLSEEAAVARVALPNPSFSARGSDHAVAENTSLNLSPGSYDAVIVGRNAILSLSSGDYFFRVLDLGVKATLLLEVGNGPVNINVTKKLNFKKEAKVQITSGEAGSDQVSFATLQDSRLTIGEKAQVLGTIIARNATVTLAKNSRFKGALYADEIDVSSGAVFQPHDSSTPLAAIQNDLDFEDEEIVGEFASGIHDYKLAANYPNPFNPSTKIVFALPEAGEVTLKIYSITGQLVRQLARGAFASGRYEFVWDAKDDKGSPVATGIYFYQLAAQKATGEALFTQTRRMTLVK